MYLLRLYSREPLYETIGHIGTPGLCIFALHLSLDRLSFGGLEFSSVRLTLAQIMSASSFSRSFTASSIVAMISLLGSVLEVIEKLRPFQGCHTSSNLLKFEISPQISSSLLKKCRFSRKSPQISSNSKNRKFHFGNLTVK